MRREHSEHDHEVEAKRRKTNEEDLDELEESDIDLDIGWVEFAAEVNGVEFLKDINVEAIVEAGTVK